MFGKRLRMAVLTTLLLTACTGSPEKQDSERYYAVVVSRATLAAEGWRAVVDALVERHGADVIVWEKSPEETRLELAAKMPKYTCFVARPEEAGHRFTVTVSRLSRALDDDPWTDTLWGILTGYEPADALRIAATAEPLEITRALDATGQFSLEPFDVARCYDEFNRGRMRFKTLGDNEIHTVDCQEDNTAGVIEALEKDRVQLMVTSAHATQHDWHMGYKGPNLVMRHKDGRLLMVDTAKKVHTLNAPERKVYIASGNCLIGDIPGKDCMATSWMHSGGANQFVGYTAVTWFGFMGWGTLSLFTDDPGRYNLTESFHFNNIRNVWRLQTEFPKHAAKNMRAYDMRVLAPFAHWELGIDKNIYKSDLLGLLFDRDIVAFYGDPAWDARIRPLPQQSFAVRVAQDAGDWLVTLHAATNGEWPGTGVFVRLPARIANWKVDRNTTGCQPVMADNFIYLPLKGKYAAGDEYTLSFSADPASTRAERTMLNDAHELAAFLRTHTVNDPEAAADIPDLMRSLSNAGGNLPEIVKGFRACQDDLTKKAYLWSLIDAPADDLRTLSGAFLNENAVYAVKSWQRAPWRHQISTRLFRDYILPFSCLDESRTPWRRMLYEKFADKVFRMKSASEAALWLDKNIFTALDVTYHATKRPKANQSVQESIDAKYASCTGLSIILAEACRAAGIPTRIVGVPVWSDLSGNHNWVEYWDDQWVYQGASPSDPRGNDWVRDKVRKATNADKWEHSVLAAVHRPKDRYFQLVWAPLDDRVPAVNITGFYNDTRMIDVELSGAGQETWVYCHDEPVYRLTGAGKRKVLLPSAVTTDEYRLVTRPIKD